MALNRNHKCFSHTLSGNCKLRSALLLFRAGRQQGHWTEQGWQLSEGEGSLIQSTESINPSVHPSLCPSLFTPICAFVAVPGPILLEVREEKEPRVLHSGLCGLGKASEFSGPPLPHL